MLIGAFGGVSHREWCRAFKVLIRWRSEAGLVTRYQMTSLLHHHLARGPSLTRPLNNIRSRNEFLDELSGHNTRALLERRTLKASSNADHGMGRSDYKDPIDNYKQRVCPMSSRSNSEIEDT